MKATKNKKRPEINKAERLVKLVAFVSGKKVIWFSLPFYEKRAKFDKVKIAQEMLIRFKNFYPNFSLQPRFYDNITKNEIKL